LIRFLCSAVAIALCILVSLCAVGQSGCAFDVYKL
jgi:hypothetical protein